RTRRAERARQRQRGTRNVECGTERRTHNPKVAVPFRVPTSAFRVFMTCSGAPSATHAFSDSPPRSTRAAARRAPPRPSSPRPPPQPPPAGALPARRTVPEAATQVLRHRHAQRTTHHTRDGHGVLRIPVQEVRRAVERIDDPHDLARARAVRRELLAHHGRAG